MRTVLLTLNACLLCLFCSVSYADNAEYDFQHAKWGMTIPEVRETEYPLRQFGFYIKTPKEHLDTLLYEKQIADKTAKVEYIFENNGLVAGKVIFQAKDFSSSNDCEEFLRTIEKALSQKYNKSVSNLKMSLFEQKDNLIILQNQCRADKVVSINYTSSQYIEQEKSKEAEQKNSDLQDLKDNL